MKWISNNGIAIKSLTMSFVFVIGQFISFILRLAFRLSLSSVDYGIFAFQVNTFLFLIVFAEGGLHVPIIAMISQNPSDDFRYLSLKKHVFALTLVLSTCIAFIHLLWAGFVTNAWLLSAVFGIFLVIYSLSIVLLSFPRGRDYLRPVAEGQAIASFLRISLLGAFILGVIPANGSFTASLIFLIGFFGWWIGLLRHETIPKLEKPTFNTGKFLYKSGIWSVFNDVGRLLPTYFSIVLLTVVVGISSAGDFDILLIVYSSASALLSGLPFVIISKSRSMPNLRALLAKASTRILGPLLFTSIILFVSASLFQDYAANILSNFGLQPYLFWSSVFLVVVGMPFNILLSVFSSYLQGRGVIRPVGMITFFCSILLIPMQFILIITGEIIGATLGIVVVNSITFVVVIAFGLLKYDSEVIVSENYS